MTYKNIQCFINLPYCKENWKALSELQLRVLQLFTLLYNFLYALLAYVNCAPLLSFEHLSPAALNHQKAAPPVHLWQLQAQRKHSLWKCWFNVAGDKWAGRSGFVHFNNWRRKGMGMTDRKLNRECKFSLLEQHKMLVLYLYFMGLEVYFGQESHTSLVKYFILYLNTCIATYIFCITCQYRLYTFYNIKTYSVFEKVCLWGFLVVVILPCS